MNNEIILYQPKDSIHIEVRMENDTVWLTQKQIAELFGTEVPAISKHIRNIYKTNELNPHSTISKMETVQVEGNRSVKRTVDLYNLDMILSVGYRVNSINATNFRIWANSVLRDYILKGYVVSNRIESIERKLYEHDEKIKLLLKTNIPDHVGVFFDGQIYDAFECIIQLIMSAKNNIILIDNYIDESVLTILTKKKQSVETTIYTKQITRVLELAEMKFNAQYGNLKIKTFVLSHDRFLIIDEAKIFLIGASIKDLGKKWFGITELDSCYISMIISKLQR